MQLGCWSAEHRRFCCRLTSGTWKLWGLDPGLVGGWVQVDLPSHFKDSGLHPGDHEVIGRLPLITQIGITHSGHSHPVKGITDVGHQDGRVCRHNVH